LEICKTNFFSRTTGWIVTILGRNVTAAILKGGQSEQTDKDLARNIFAKYGSNPSSGS
jgi:hypothetical protein